jgi:hypothetical protein
MRLICSQHFCRKSADVNNLEHNIVLAKIPLTQNC